MKKKNKQVLPTVSKLVPIRDTNDYRHQGIILMKDTAMQKILTKSGKLAKSNEFQVHYWSLVLRHVSDDGSVLDIAIPTVYFNYKQEVTSAHIDFDMKEVGEISDKLLPLHNAKVNELLKSGIIDNVQAKLGVEFELMSVNLGSQHAHPN